MNDGGAAKRTQSRGGKTTHNELNGAVGNGDQDENGNVYESSKDTDLDHVTDIRKSAGVFSPKRF